MRVRRACQRVVVEVEVGNVEGRFRGRGSLWDFVFAVILDCCIGILRLDRIRV